MEIVIEKSKIMFRSDIQAGGCVYMFLQKPGRVCRSDGIHDTHMRVGDGGATPAAFAANQSARRARRRDRPRPRGAGIRPA